MEIRRHHLPVFRGSLSLQAFAEIIVDLTTNPIGAGIFGSSVVTATTIRKAELRQCGDDERMSVGTLASSGMLRFLIPPSIILN